MQQHPLTSARSESSLSLASRNSRRYRVFTAKDIDQIPPLGLLPESNRVAIRAVAAVLPFRVNNYVIEDLIDWSDIPNDPIFRLTFPQPEMLEPTDFSRMVDLVGSGAPTAEVRSAAREIQGRLNPHPSGQLEMNVPRLNDEDLPGTQHKYRETVLFFPAAGQTCHAYCTYCFRWAQFVGIQDLKFSSSDGESLRCYLEQHREVTSVLFTGGDPMIMKTTVLRRFVDPVLDPALDHIESIRFGTKAPGYWPYRFTSDPDADDLLRLFERIRRTGRHVALMAHYSHPRELETPVARRALRRIQDAGAVVRCQAPLIKGRDGNPRVALSQAAHLRRKPRSPLVVRQVNHERGPLDFSTCVPDSPK